MRYRDFIDDIAQLAESGERLKTSSTSHESREFRDWRHRVESLVTEAEAHGYRLPGAFRSSTRRYASPYSSEMGKAFNRDLSDSVTELQHLVEQYRKYGEPNHIQIVTADSMGPALPTTVTLSWLWKNVSIGFWGKVTAIVFAVFIAGVLMGRTEEYQRLESWIRGALGNG